MSKQHYKFNPSLVLAPVLQKTLVGREKELSTILKKIEECAQGTSLRHFLVVGPRGIGKTHFILLIYHTIKGSIGWNGKFKNLSRYWIPIRFAEEEYSIATLGEFLLRIAQNLEEETGELGRKPSEAGLEPMALLEEASTEKVLDLLLANRERLNKRFVVLVDNFHQILDRFTNEDRGRLRDILMSKDLFLIIGTAPTLFERITSYEEPFYNFFENIHLGQISDDEGVELITRWWEQENRHDLLNRYSELRPKLNALLHLTGGNPRLILSVYSVLTEASVVEVESAFIALLDEMTPYFQLRMMELSPQQAKILDAMASMEGPASPTQIAEEARLEVRKVTSQLKRMEMSGYVGSMKKRGKREVLYDVKERLFRLWRQMRIEAGRRYLRFLVSVIAAWYSEEELDSQFRELSSRIELAIGEREKETAEKALRQMWYLQEACPLGLYQSIVSTRLRLLVELEDVGAEEEIIRLREKAQKNGDTDLIALAYLNEAALHNKMGETEKEYKASSSYLVLRPDDGHVWHLLGHAADELGRYEEAVGYYRNALQADAKEAKAWYCMGNAYSRLGRYQEGIEVYDKALEEIPGWYEALNNMGLALSELDRYQEAIEVILEATRIDPARDEAWANLGHMYIVLKQYMEASDTFRRYLEIKPDDVAGWINLSTTFLHLNRDQEALEAAGKAIELAPGKPEAWANFAHAATHMGNYKQSIEAMNQAISLSPSEAIFFMNRGSDFRRIGKLSAALRDYKEALDIAQGNGDEELMEANAISIVDILTVSSAKRAIKNKPILAERYLKRGLAYARLVPAGNIREILTAYFDELLRKKKIGFLTRALEMVEQAEIPDVNELLKFHRAAIQFLETKDRTVLNKLFPELRELVESLTKQ